MLTNEASLLLVTKKLVYEINLLFVCVYIYLHILVQM